MKILGINFDIWITSACLLEDGKIIAACPEERLNRQKLSREFPRKAIEYCLKQAGCTIAEVDYVALGWNPGMHINSFNPRYSGSSRWRGEQLVSIPNQMLAIHNGPRVHHVLQEFQLENSKLKIMYVDHHKAHAGMFFLSPFEEAAILTSDGRGEHDTVTFGFGQKNKITEIKKMMYPTSVGMLYGTVTQFLGYRRDSDEWKVMALYSYFADQGENPYLPKMRKLVRLLPEGEFELDLNYFGYYLYDFPTWYNSKFVQEFGPPRKKDEEITERHHQIAHALQVVFEEVMIYQLNWLYEKTKLPNLVVSGGSMMNSVFNGKILQKTLFQKVFISPCPDDSGTSIGAATYLYNHILENPERTEMIHNYFGPEYGDEEIRKELDKYKLSYKKIENISAFTAQKLTEGKIIGWFQGKMEFGQRALGNRSILADPRDPSMKDKVNASIKYREAFRPFAPAILQEDVEEYFELIGSKEVRFMEKVYPIKKEKQKLIPAVTHVDGTGRLQTVEKEQNPRFHGLISEFKKITGIPVILNTSFNLNGEPIVCSPSDAIRTFYSCGLDILVMGDYVLEKNYVLEKMR